MSPDSTGSFKKSPIPAHTLRVDFIDLHVKDKKRKLIWNESLNMYNLNCVL